jgi:hypothetical protein
VRPRPGPRQVPQQELASLAAVQAQRMRQQRTL